MCEFDGISIFSKDLGVLSYNQSRASGVTKLQG